MELFPPYFSSFIPHVGETTISWFLTRGIWKNYNDIFVATTTREHLVGREPRMLNDTVLHNENLSLPKCQQQHHLEMLKVILQLTLISLHLFLALFTLYLIL